MSVTTISFNPARHEILEGGTRKDPVGGGRVDAGGTRFIHRLGGRGERAGGVDHVVDDHRRLALDVADHVPDLRDLLGGALLVEDRELGADLGGEFLVELHPAGVGRHHHEVGQAEVPRSTG